MAGHLRAVDAADRPADPLSEAEGAAKLAELTCEIAGRMPVGSPVRSLALRQAGRWYTLAGCANPVRLRR